MNKISEVKNIIRVFQGKSMYDCLVRWDGSDKFVSCAVDIQNSKDLKPLADHLLKYNLISSF